MTEDPAFLWDSPMPRLRRGPVRTTEQRVRKEPLQQPTDAVLVPLDEWSRLLRQLGNLHDAGQQMAEARERAARAETESEFLKERMRDLREQLTAAKEIVDQPPPEPEPMPAFPEWITRRWLERRKLKRRSSRP
ncbi:MAG: hypothetical protein OEM66_00910 [Acidimicrobiia bacterium]|nr:hypothetical protein [Acidimicrobiia bacterium]